MTVQINIPSATAVRTLRANGGNLFRAAVDNLGNALQWTRIAEANQLLDPFLPINTPLNLTVPPINLAANDTGVLQPNGPSRIVLSSPKNITLPAISGTSLVPVDISIPVIS